MLHFVRAAAFAVAAVALALASGASADEKKEEKKGEVLKTVIDATYEFDKDKKKLTVTATGQVPTGGWKDAKLTPRVMKEKPKDGIYEYDLMAVRPTGIVDAGAVEGEGDAHLGEPAGRYQGREDLRRRRGRQDGQVRQVTPLAAS